jgi:LPS export ABC transporter protein LptC
MINPTTSLLAYAFLILFFLTGCENNLNDIQKITSTEDANIEIAENIEILYSTDAHVRARLVSKQLMRHNTKKPYLEFNKGVAVTFFDEQLVQSSKLTAGYGRVDEQTHEMIARNNVEVVTAKNEKLNTEELIWDNKNKKIFTEQFVTIQTKDEIIYGDGMEANEDMSNYKIKKIRGTISLKEDPLKGN